MRLLIFLLALSSAFFVSNAQSYEPDMDDLKPPKTDIKPCESASWNGAYNESTKVCSFDDAKMQSCEKLASTIKASSSTEYQWNAGGTCALEGGSMKIFQEGVRIYSDGTRLPTTQSYSIYYANLQGLESVSCPPPTFLDHIIPVNSSAHPSGTMCAKEKNYCPEPNSGSQPDSFTFGNGAQRDVCYKNSDGTQCKIKTDDQGGYYHPFSYRSQEPVQCARSPDKEVDKTSPPDDKPAPEETDDAPEMAELDALNKINDNLDAMNENQVAASDSNDERLDRVSEEIQIGNEILGEIRYNTDLTQSNTDDTNGLLGETNALLADILDNTGGAPDDGGEEPCTGEDCETDTFTITAGRKDAEKGLNSIFTDEQRQVITDEIDEKKQEIEDYFEQIETESSALFDINPSLSGGYEERIEVIKGVEVDMGLGRLSSFFQLIAAAVMLCSTLTALYILLGP